MKSDFEEMVKVDDEVLMTFKNHGLEDLVDSVENRREKLEGYEKFYFKLVRCNVEDCQIH